RWGGGHLDAVYLAVSAALSSTVIFVIKDFDDNHRAAQRGTYLAVSAALSSTVIIVKILYDKRELDTLVGRITLGVLVAQDLFAILFLAVQPTLKHPAVGPLMASLFRVVVLVASALMSSRYLLPVLFRAVAQLPELVLVGALA